MSNESFIHDQVIRKILRYAETHPLVTGLIALGSIGRNAFHYFSDIDLALVIADSVDKRGIASDIVKNFGEDVKYKLTFLNPMKLVLYLEGDLTKLDLFIIEEFKEIDQYYRGSAITEPEATILYDQTGELSRLVRVKTPTSETETDLEIDRQVKMFLYAVEAFSNAQRMSDGYRSYFEYNLALHRLVRLVYLLRGGTRFLFLPRNFARDYLTPEEQQIFRGLNGQIYLKAINKTKRDLYTFF